MPKIYANCQKSMQKTWKFIFCHLNLVRAVYYLSFKLLVRSVAPLTKILPPFLWFGGGLCYKHRRIRHGDCVEENRIKVIFNFLLAFCPFWVQRLWLCTFALHLTVSSLQLSTWKWKSCSAAVVYRELLQSYCQGVSHLSRLELVTLPVSRGPGARTQISR